MLPEKSQVTVEKLVYTGLRLAYLVPKEEA